MAQFEVPKAEGAQCSRFGETFGMVEEGKTGGKDCFEALDEMKFKMTDQLELHPARGRLFLDVNDGSTILTDIETYEQQTLPNGKWELTFSDDGMEALLVRDGDGSESEGEIVEPSAILRQGSVMKTAHGERMLVLASPAGDIHHVWSLDLQLTKHYESRVVVEVGTLSVRGTVSSATMLWKRTNADRIFWCAADMYELFGLDT